MGGASSDQLRIYLTGEGLGQLSHVCAPERLDALHAGLMAFALASALPPARAVDVRKVVRTSRHLVETHQHSHGYHNVLHVLYMAAEEGGMLHRCLADLTLGTLDKGDDEAARAAAVSKALEKAFAAQGGDAATRWDLSVGVLAAAFQDLYQKGDRQVVDVHGHSLDLHERQPDEHSHAAHDGISEHDGDAVHRLLAYEGVAEGSHMPCTRLHFEMELYERCAEHFFGANHPAQVERWATEMAARRLPSPDAPLLPPSLPFHVGMIPELKAGLRRAGIDLDAAIRAAYRFAHRDLGEFLGIRRPSYVIPHDARSWMAQLHLCEFLTRDAVRLFHLPQAELSFVHEAGERQYVHYWETITYAMEAEHVRAAFHKNHAQVPEGRDVLSHRILFMSGPLHQRAPDADAAVNEAVQVMAAALSTMRPSERIRACKGLMRVRHSDDVVIQAEEELHRKLRAARHEIARLDQANADVLESASALRDAAREALGRVAVVNVAKTQKAGA